MTVRTLINMPKTARRGEVIEIRVTIGHPMETGYRPGADGKRLPRDIIQRFSCRYDGETVFAADLYPAISANPNIRPIWCAHFIASPPLAQAHRSVRSHSSPPPSHATAARRRCRWW